MILFEFVGKTCLSIRQQGLLPIGYRLQNDFMSPYRWRMSNRILPDFMNVGESFLLRGGEEGGQLRVTVEAALPPLRDVLLWHDFLLCRLRLCWLASGLLCRRG